MRTEAGSGAVQPPAKEHRRLPVNGPELRKARLQRERGPPTPGFGLPASRTVR